MVTFVSDAEVTGGDFSFKHAENVLPKTRKFAETLFIPEIGHKHKFMKLQLSASSKFHVNPTLKWSFLSKSVVFQFKMKIEEVYVWESYPVFVNIGGASKRFLGTSVVAAENSRDICMLFTEKNIENH
jgi:hypothetical protein